MHDTQVRNFSSKFYIRSSRHKNDATVYHIPIWSCNYTVKVYTRGITTVHTSSKTPPKSIAVLGAVVTSEQLERGDGRQPDCFTACHVTRTFSLLLSSPADRLVLPQHISRRVPSKHHIKLLTVQSFTALPGTTQPSNPCETVKWCYGLLGSVTTTNGNCGCEQRRMWVWTGRLAEQVSWLSLRVGSFCHIIKQTE